MPGKKIRKRSLASLQNYKDVFSTLKGKNVLWDLFKECHLISPSFVPGDSHGSAFNDGKRSVALYIIKKLNQKPSDMEKLINKGVDYDRELWQSDE